MAEDEIEYEGLSSDAGLAVRRHLEAMIFFVNVLFVQVNMAAGALVSHGRPMQHEMNVKILTTYSGRDHRTCCYVPRRQYQGSFVPLWRIHFFDFPCG